METTFLCAYCGEPNDIFVDASGGPNQRLTEDCQVCCRPNELQIQILEPGEPLVQVRRESE